MPLCGEFWKSKERLKGSLQKGLNNTATDSAEGFEALNKMVDPLEEIGAEKWSLQTRKKLKVSKLYLKTTYSYHCREESACSRSL